MSVPAHLRASMYPSCSQAGLAHKPRVISTIPLGVDLRTAGAGSAQSAARSAHRTQAPPLHSRTMSAIRSMVSAFRSLWRAANSVT